MQKQKFVSSYFETLYPKEKSTLLLKRYSVNLTPIIELLTKVVNDLL